MYLNNRDVGCFYLTNLANGSGRAEDENWAFWCLGGG